MTRYSLPADTLQSMINTLAQLPYAQVGDMLSAVRAECTQQDQQRAEQQAEAIRAEVRQQIEAEAKG